MNGQEFFQFLMQFYYLENQQINGNWHLVRWLPKNDGTFNFQFQFLNNRKSIPQNWLVDAKNAINNGETINRTWLNRRFNESNFNDCRASLAIWLLQNH